MEHIISLQILKTEDIQTEPKRKAKRSAAFKEEMMEKQKLAICHKHADPQETVRKQLCLFS